jgi:prepilin-type N-terminal cleavage/methylation domain-containing protein
MISETGGGKEMNKKGVTLIELIVVFVIIAIAAGLLAPNVGGWLPRYRLRSATRDIVSTMRDAQMKAVSRRLQYQVDFNGPPANSYILQYNTTGIWVDDGARQTAPSGITVNIAGLPGGIATFNTDCTCPNAGNITLSYQKGGVTQAQKGIFLNPATGRVTIQ